MRWWFPIRTIRMLVVQGVLLSTVLLADLVPAHSAAGTGDGTTSSSWMVDDRLLPALAALHRKDFAEAVELLSAIVADRPRFADAWNYLGFSLRKSGVPDKSEDAYLTALRLDPKHRGAHAYLGVLYTQTGRRNQAVTLEIALTRICPHGCPELDELRAELKKVPEQVRN